MPHPVGRPLFAAGYPPWGACADAADPPVSQTGPVDDDQRNDDVFDAPVCPRHPQRVSRLQCRTCGRPACPDCQHPAPAGFDCTDCVERVHSTIDPSAVATSGPPPGVNPPWQGGTAVTATGAGTQRTAVVRLPRPLVTYGLIGLCVVIYLVQMLKPEVTDDGSFYPIAGYVEPWRFITAAFLHSPDTMTHLLFNMMGLYVMGQFLESFLGRARFVAVYLLSALGGSVGFLLTAPRLDISDQAALTVWAQSMVGASGAVFGLFAAAFLVLRRTGAPVAGMVVLIALNLALPFIYPNIAWQAHLGGAVVGFVATAVILATAQRRAVTWAALAGIAVALAVSAWIKYEVNGGALGVILAYAR